MTKLIRRIGVFLGILFLGSLPGTAHADMFGGDVVVLTQILANAVEQLSQLEQLLGTGQDNLNLLRDINRGINDSLQIMRTISPYTDPGIYKDWRTVERAMTDLTAIYGRVVDSRDAVIQRNADQSVAEAVTLNNQVYDYTQSIDGLGEQIEEFSHQVSPGGAQKLTAQGTGILITVMNQQLRTQATALKLQAQTLAIENQKEKEKTRFLLDSSSALQAAMQNRPILFESPRF
jgi:hypothetical protein